MACLPRSKLYVVIDTDCATFPLVLDVSAVWRRVFRFSFIHGAPYWYEQIFGIVESLTLTDLLFIQKDACKIILLYFASFITLFILFSILYDGWPFFEYYAIQFK